MTDRRSYYAVIPANIRYDERLTPNAKLLYGEITALCNEKGYCWATNDYFAKLYSVSKTSISTWIKNLVECGYIESTILYKEGTKEIDKRYLRLLNGATQENLNTPTQENLNTPTQENLKENNTLINNTLINNTKNKGENTRTIFLRLIGDYNISEYLGEKLSDWITYKMERKESYKEQGMKSLLRQIEKNAIQYGDEAIVNLIDECMAANWKGIIWDKLKNKQEHINKDRIASRVSDVDNW